jgi:hypothetical protein
LAVQLKKVFGTNVHPAFPGAFGELVRGKERVLREGQREAEQLAGFDGMCQRLAHGIGMDIRHVHGPALTKIRSLAAAVLRCCTDMKKAGFRDRNRPLTWSEVFTFMPDLGRRGPGGVLPTG